MKKRNEKDIRYKIKGKNIIQRFNFNFMKIRIFHMNLQIFFQSYGNICLYNYVLVKT